MTKREKVNGSAVGRKDQRGMAKGRARHRGNGEATYPGQGRTKARRVAKDGQRRTASARPPRH